MFFHHSLIFFAKLWKFPPKNSIVQDMLNSLSDMKLHNLCSIDPIISLLGTCNSMAFHYFPSKNKNLTKKFIIWI
jgi:hypothetical protein